MEHNVNQLIRLDRRTLACAGDIVVVKVPNDGIEVVGPAEVHTESAEGVPVRTNYYRSEDGKGATLAYLSSVMLTSPLYDSQLP